MENNNEINTAESLIQAIFYETPSSHFMKEILVNMEKLSGTKVVVETDLFAFKYYETNTDTLSIALDKKTNNYYLTHLLTGKGERTKIVYNENFKLIDVKYNKETILRKKTKSGKVKKVETPNILLYDLYDLHIDIFTKTPTLTFEEYVLGMQPFDCRNLTLCNYLRAAFPTVSIEKMEQCLKIIQNPTGIDISFDIKGRTSRACSLSSTVPDSFDKIREIPLRFEHSKWDRFFS